MRNQKFNRFAILEVWWDDTTSDARWNDLTATYLPSVVKTLGFFIKNVKKEGRCSLQLAHSICQSEDLVEGDYTVIPWATITKIQELEVKDGSN